MRGTKWGLKEWWRAAAHLQNIFQFNSTNFGEFAFQLNYLVVFLLRKFCVWVNNLCFLLWIAVFFFFFSFWILYVLSSSKTICILNCGFLVCQFNCIWVSWILIVSKDQPHLIPYACVTAEDEISSEKKKRILVDLGKPSCFSIFSTVASFFTFKLVLCRWRGLGH